MVAVSQLFDSHPPSAIVSHIFSVEYSVVPTWLTLNSAQFSACVPNYEKLSFMSIYAGNYFYGKYSRHDAVLYRQGELEHVGIFEALFGLAPSTV